MKKVQFDLNSVAITIVALWLWLFVTAHAVGLLSGDGNLILQYQNIMSKDPQILISNNIILGFKCVGFLLAVSEIFYLASFATKEFKSLGKAKLLKWAIFSTILAGTIYGALMRIVGNQQGAALLFFFCVLLYLFLNFIENKAEKINTIFHSVMLLPMYVIIFYTMGMPGWAKLFGGAQVIDKYVHMFQGSFVSKLPGGTPLMIYILGILELSVPLLLVVSLIRGEYKLYAGKTWLNVAMIISLFTFGMLCFGLSVLFNFAGSANLVFYPVLTLWMLISINQANVKTVLT